MAKKVLIVDDDQEMMRIIKKDLEKYKRTFAVLTANDGLAAVELLKKNQLSLVITDLEMPQMDGFALLTYIKERYPDVSTIAITDSSTLEEQKLAKEKGALGYIEKPFIIEDLARKIVTCLKKEDDGGVLHGIAPGTFLQLVEMEEKTCTIRLTNDKSENQGVLFFKNGDLLEARYKALQGKDAAYKILAWEEATLSIQESCSLTKNNVEADLQALLLEAMRQKDEVEEEGEQELVVEIEEPEIMIEEQEPVIIIEEEPSTKTQAEPEIVIEEREPEIVMELEEEKPAPSVSAKKKTTTPSVSSEVKKPATTVTGQIKKSSLKKSEPEATAQATQTPATQDIGVDYSTGSNFFETIGDLKDALFASSFLRFIFKTSFMVVTVGLIGFSYLYFTMESDKDLLKQINEAKALIHSKQEALFQLDEEIQRLYTEKEERFKNHESEIVMMELDLKISDLEEKQEKIDVESKSQNKVLEDCQVKLEAMKRKTLYERLLERMKEHLI